MLLGLFLAGAGAGLALAAHLPGTATVCLLVGTLVGAWSLPRHSAVARPDTAPAESQYLVQERRLQVLEALLDQSPTPLLILENSGAPRPANRAARRLFTAEVSVRELQERLRAENMTAPVESRLLVQLNAAGRLRTFALLFTDVIGAEQPLRLVALVDIQPEVQAAEAAALRELLRVMSHEIMNTLTPISSLAQSAAELLAEGGRANVRAAEEAVEVFARRTQGLHRFVEAYRTLARLPEPQPRSTSLGAVLDEAARLFEVRWGARGIRLHVERPKPDIIAHLDPDLCAQALLNLLANAAEAAQEVGGDAPEVRLSAEGGPEGVAIRVEDNGRGVAPEVAERLFRPFFTTKAGGSGIGLSIARQAIVSQGGQITLEARQTGACFAILL